MIYNNLGPGNTFSNGDWQGQNVSIIGITFTTTGAGTLSTILLPIATTPNAPPGVTFTLYSNSTGAPGSQIESWTGNPPAYDGGEPPLTTLTSVQKPAISSGTQYWFLITQAPNQIMWFSSPLGNDGMWAGDSINSLIQSQIPNAGTPALQLNSSEGD